MMGFIDQIRAEGHAVESIVRVLREQGLKVAARTYRTWRQGSISVRTVTDALVLDAVRDAAWRVEVLPDGTAHRRMTPEGLYGRRKITALIPRTAIADASRGAVDRAMRTLGLVGMTWAKAIRTTIPAKDSIRAGDLLNRDFTAPQPDHLGDRLHVGQNVGGMGVCRVHPRRVLSTDRGLARADHQHTDLVMIPLRMVWIP